MANVQKYTRAQIGGLTRHFERAKKDNGEYYQFGNQEIDTARTHLNYNLAPEHDQLTFISQRISEVECVSRANINVMCNWVVTAPKELSAAEHRLFFEEAYKFLNGRYAGGGEQNVVSACVHMDEVSPHLHYAFVPVVHDEKKDIDKVSAKAVINRRDLQTFHQDLERHMAAVFDREIGILNEATRDGNKSIEELKRGTAQRALLSIQNEIDTLQGSKSSLVADMTLQAATFKEKGQALINAYEEKKNALDGKLGAIEAGVKGKQLTRKQIDKINVKVTRPLFGGSDSDEVTILLSDWENIKKTALVNTGTEEEILILKKRNKELTQAINQLGQEKRKLEQDKKGLQGSMNERVEMATLKSKLQYVPRDVLEQLIDQYQPKKLRDTIDLSQQL